MQTPAKSAGGARRLMLLKASASRAPTLARRAVIGISAPAPRPTPCCEGRGFLAHARRGFLCGTAAEKKKTSPVLQPGARR
jgi:hypothetical protein